MILTAETYFSPEAMREYLSVSQYKDFVGTHGYSGCEAKAMAKIRGEWVEEPSIAMLIGSYCDAHFEGTLGVFKAQHPEIFKKDGTLKAEFAKANDIIARCERDEYFSTCMSGEKQVILSAEIFGLKWKVKIDSLHRGRAIIDLKVMRAIRDRLWVRDLGNVSFATYWGYDIQGAVYQKVTEVSTGEKIPFLLAVASKEDCPDIEVVGFQQEELDACLIEVSRNANRIVDIKAGKIEPDRCEHCDYCRTTKILRGPVHHSILTTTID